MVFYIDRCKEIVQIVSAHWYLRTYTRPKIDPCAINAIAVNPIIQETLNTITLY